MTRMVGAWCLLTSLLILCLPSGCSKDCSSPAEGCPCDPVKDLPFCDGWSDPSVGYTCLSGRWSTGPDGPCMPGDGGRRSADVPMSLDLATEAATHVDGPEPF